MSWSEQELLREALLHVELMLEHARGDVTEQLVVDAVCMRLSAGVEVLNRLAPSARDDIFSDQGGTPMTTIAPIHPGEVLLEDFLTPLGVTQHQLAISISVPPRRINEIVHGMRWVSADTALRLARYFGTSDRFWLNLQTRFDLEIEKDHLGAVLERIHPLQGA